MNSSPEIGEDYCYFSFCLNHNDPCVVEKTISAWADEAGKPVVYLKIALPSLLSFRKWPCDFTGCSRDSADDDWYICHYNVNSQRTLLDLDD